MGGMMVPIGLGFGRLGCLLAGCCFGVESDGPLGLVFPPNSDASVWQAKHELLEHAHLPSLPVVPTQIYESIGAFAISAFGILYLHQRKRYDGHVFVVFLALYALLRFGIEFWRQDERGAYFSLSTSQWIGLGMLGFAFWVHRVRTRRAPVALRAG
jgi:phosphatidylglycerol:prolipoprotein diacylglycerol transferase